MLTFPNITPEVFTRVLDELRKHSTVKLGTESKEAGMELWHIEGSGIKASALYCGGDVIQVEIDHKPFYVSEGMIRGKIQDAIEVAQRELGQGGAA